MRLAARRHNRRYRHASWLTLRALHEKPLPGAPRQWLERQRGRVRAGNIIDVAAEADAIVAAVERAMSPGFAKSVQGISNPYGDGRAGERIASVLSEVELDARLLAKRALEVEPLPGRLGEWFFVQRPRR